MVTFTKDSEKEIIIKQYWPQIGRAASGYENRSALSDELAQEMALSVWRSLDRFNGQCSMNTYVYRVIHNTAIDHIRRHSKLSEDELSDKTICEHTSPEADALQAQRQKHLMNAVNKLPLSLRQVMLLKLEDLNNVEISDVLGISEANVGIRLHRAKEQLTKLLAGMN
ncbi:sigma-70 family RNA polymerase sigma factor [Pseudoalteromonas luteoviolacea]|uniref:RNA polymerase sigma factor n=1 Tax=Pseudoalteromonas luteoviolacea TaxID=43657 RepID=UPI001B36A79B|nr:sigma-70 family RNA polymerase sigma factor [Pseudoalteromonas luteoviolacea]MBQ4812437.1 sigma-70 family RNA polymerase sigma factor [Pseudoalteromonas luteoviolacea]